MTTSVAPLFDAEEAGRFWAKVDKSGDCWEWTASHNGRGYGQFFVSRNGKKASIRAHRWAYESVVGPIPDGLTLDHLCRHPWCVRPDHLEPVTMRENLLRGNGWSGRHARATHCPRGHEYTLENTVYDHGTRRRCRTCKNARRRVGFVESPVSAYCLQGQHWLCRPDVTPCDCECHDR